MPEYDLKSLALPRLSGAGLRAFAAALANPITRPLLMPSLLKQGGFARFRALRLDEPPTFLLLAGAARAGGQPHARGRAALGQRGERRRTIWAVGISSGVETRGSEADS